MTPMIFKLFELSLFFFALGCSSLILIGCNRTKIQWVVSYTLIVAIGVWITGELKWVLMGEIIFMLIAASYTTWNLHQQMEGCMHQIKEIDKTKTEEGK
jgi:hypothetical protein